MKNVEKVEGETIEAKIRRIVYNKEPITDGAPEIYTEKKEGVIAGHNVRTDRWEIAAEGMDIVHRSATAKREDKADSRKNQKQKKQKIQHNYKTAKPSRYKAPQIQPLNSHYSRVLNVVRIYPYISSR